MKKKLMGYCGKFGRYILYIYKDLRDKKSAYFKV